MYRTKALLPMVLTFAFWIVVVRAGTDLTPDDTCIVDLQLPPAATVTVDGKEYGHTSQVVFNKLVRQQIYSSRFKVSLKGGEQQDRSVLIRGGWRVRFAVSEPNPTRPELALQMGHSSNISGSVRASFSADGRYVFTKGFGDKIAIVWDAATGVELRRFATDFAELSPDGRLILTREYDIGTLRDYDAIILRDVATGKELRRFTGDHFYRSINFMFTADGSLVVSVWSQPATIEPRLAPVLRAWDVATGKEIRKVSLRDGGFVAASQPMHDRQILIGGYFDGSVDLWNLETSSVIRRFDWNDAKYRLKSQILSPNGQQILVAQESKEGNGGGQNDRVMLWDTAAEKELWRFTYGNGGVLLTAMSPDGRRILVGSIVERQPTYLLDAATGKEIRRFKWGTVWGLAFSPDGQKALVGGKSDATLRDLASGNEVRQFRGQSASIAKASISPDGRYMLIAGYGGTAVLRDLTTDKVIHKFETAYDDLAFSPSSRRVLVYSGFETILWDIAANKKCQTFDRYSSLLTEYDGSAFSPDGRTVLLCKDKTPILLDCDTGREILRLEGHGGTIAGMGLSPDGRRILTRGMRFQSDGMARLWDATTGKEIQHFPDACGMAFSPDGRQMIIGQDSYSQKTGQHFAALLCDAATGNVIRRLDGLYFNHAAFSGDGHLLLICDRFSNIVCLWDVINYRELCEFEGHTNAVRSVAFSPDGQKAVTAGDDGTVRFWDIATGVELARLVYLQNGDDWLVATPDGLFDGSADARQRVAFRVGEGLNVVPVERFFQDFYRPGLLASIWQGDRPQAEVKLGHSLPPTLKIISPKSGDVEASSIAIDAEATDQGGGVSDLSIYQNGSRVLADGPTMIDGKKIRRTFKVALVEGENRFRIHAASGDGSWEAEPAEITLRYEKPLAKNEMYLLTVGVSRYGDGALNLQYAAADAKAMSNLFAKRGKALYQAVHIMQLLDEQATRAAIKESLREIGQKTNPQDTLVAFMAGHGTMLGQRYYFIPHELRRKAASLEDDIRKQGLPGDELSDWIGAARAIRRIQIYDTCASGGALALNHKARSGFAFRGAIERLARAQGIFTIAAASAGEEAHEAEELEHGVLSYALLAGLKSVDRGPLENQWVHPSSSDQVVGVLEWFTFAANHVPRLTEKLYGTAQDVPMSAQGQNFPVLPLEK